MLELVGQSWALLRITICKQLEPTGESPADNDCQQSAALLSDRFPPGLFRDGSVQLDVELGRLSYILLEQMFSFQ